MANVETTSVRPDPGDGEVFRLEGTREDGELGDTLELCISAGVFTIDRFALRLALDLIERVEDANQ